MLLGGFVFFFQAEDGIRDRLVTGVQTCALPIWEPRVSCLNPGKPSRDLLQHVSRPDSPTMAREQGRAPPRHPHGDPTSLAPHERLTDLAVVPREKPHTGAAAREQPRDSPVIER